jgi:hypothetical protein
MREKTMNDNDMDAAAVRNMLGTALDDMEMTGNDVPAVVAGYERRIKVRRYQALGATLSVVAVAAVGVNVLPGGGRAASAAAVSDYPTGNFPNDGCTQHWVTPGPHDQGGWVPSPTASQERDFCNGLMGAVHDVFPGAQLLITQTPDLQRDARIDQAKLNAYNLANSQSQASVRASRDPATPQDPAPHPPALPPDLAAFGKALDAETKRLHDHPEDPANEVSGQQYTLKTTEGSADFEASFLVPGTPVRHLDCAGVQPSECASISLPDGWHGALVWGSSALDPKAGAGSTNGVQLDLSDGRGHVFEASSGMEFQAAPQEEVWPTGKKDAQGRPIYADRAGHQTTDVTQDAYGGWFTALKALPSPPQPLTPQEFTKLFSSQAFSDFIGLQAREGKSGA